MVPHVKLEEQPSEPWPDLAPPPVALVARPDRATVALAFAPAYMNEPDVTAQPRDERTALEFEERGRLPRLDEIEFAEWSRDRWRE